ncbi:hypothetical protein BraRD5C2_33370 [Bradyrhizobium sp. RD5-C2]|nr:hypothetical protein BraRD5C2_33370 [Bradyrhizobium sp. RD5-C2]
MLTEFDQNTIANMTAALDFVCKKIPADKDSDELRKQIADGLILCARNGSCSLADLQAAGLLVLSSHLRSRHRHGKLFANIAGTFEYLLRRKVK